MFRDSFVGDAWTNWPLGLGANCRRNCFDGDEGVMLLHGPRPFCDGRMLTAESCYNASAGSSFAYRNRWIDHDDDILRARPGPCPNGA